MIRRLTILFATLSLSACATTSGPSAGPVTVGPDTIGPVTIGIAAINDFHGNLEPPKQSAFIKNASGELIAVPAGGAAYLASAIDSVRAKYPRHLTIAAGDVMGSAPLVSSLFIDEPAVDVLNRMGLDFSAVGNHEFDFGVPELLRKQSGGCAKLTEREP